MSWLISAIKWLFKWFCQCYLHWFLSATFSSVTLLVDRSYRDSWWANEKELFLIKLHIWSFEIVLSKYYFQNWSIPCSVKEGRAKNLTKREEFDRQIHKEIMTIMEVLLWWNMLIAEQILWERFKFLSYLYLKHYLEYTHIR